MTAKNNRPGKTSAALKIVITRVFDALRELVWQAWTKPEHIKEWSAPRGFAIPVSEGDLRPGGAWRACMLAPDGARLLLGGIYREIIEHELLVFSHAWMDDDGKPGHETLAVSYTHLTLPTIYSV